jgi:calcium-translocating P-type ATPase
MKKLIKNNVLVKRLVGIETAGSMNILFTDKTGTITEGKPKCEKIICYSGEFNNIADIRKCGAIYETLCISAKYNTDIKYENGTLTGGNSTDRAIFEMFEKEENIGVDVLNKVPFSSDRKYSLVQLKNGKSIIKGAAEIVLLSCDSILKCDGTLEPLDGKKYFDEYMKLCSMGARIIAVAVSSEAQPNKKALVALIAMKDKIRASARQATRSLIDAGIQIVMVTGDSKETASAIARESGIISSPTKNIILSADELSQMSDNDVKSILPNLRVLARAMPRDKTRLVRIAQELNMVVGMTGDGINDAPSLKLADVGFAMGSGTDIAKSASDIVILDDSIDSIGKTVLFGRTIFKSIRKFITFQLIMNLAACGVSIIGQFIGVEAPITIIQMLWINIIMDTLGGLAFSGEPASVHYMKEKPKSRDEAILSSEMLHQIGYTGAYTLALSIFFLSAQIVRKYYGFSSSTESFYTAFYALFIFSGIANCFTSRSERLWILYDIGKNIPFLLIMLGISIIQVGMIYFGGEVFRCVPLNVGELMLSLTLAFTVIPFDCIRRIVKKLT